MTELYSFIGTKIRELRRGYKGNGISQMELASQLGTTANTVSRWETAAYKPSVLDLQRLAKFFGVSISFFFPEQEDERVRALMSATGDLRDDDFDELVEYARFRKARQTLRRAKRTK